MLLRGRETEPQAVLKISLQLMEGTCWVQRPDAVKPLPRVIDFSETLETVLKTFAEALPGVRVALVLPCGLLCCESCTAHVVDGLGLSKQKQYREHRSLIQRLRRTNPRIAHIPVSHLIHPDNNTPARAHNIQMVHQWFSRLTFLLHIHKRKNCIAITKWVMWLIRKARLQQEYEAFGIFSKNKWFYLFIYLIFFCSSLLISPVIPI